MFRLKSPRRRLDMHKRSMETRRIVAYPGRGWSMPDELMIEEQRADVPARISVRTQA
jgi:hypothetical protein